MGDPAMPLRRRRGRNRRGSPAAPTPAERVLTDSGRGRQGLPQCRGPATSLLAHMSWRHVRLWWTREDTAPHAPPPLAFAFPTCAVGRHRMHLQLELARLARSSSIRSAPPPVQQPRRRQTASRGHRSSPRYTAAGAPCAAALSRRSSAYRPPAPPPAHRQHRELPRRPDVGPS
ncbi:hypothetical protein SEVIR_8G245936v4 [Setaria viridis]|nr:uncharacterized protein LOC117833543 [Setaria viridis]